MYMNDDDYYEELLHHMENSFSLLFEFSDIQNAVGNGTLSYMSMY
jgi:hypothetical protein